MNHASLFSGIGGFDLASEWMGWNNVLHCEINPFGQSVLKHYWPNAKSYEDITKTDFTIHRGTIDIVSAGFPCQPFSAAGKRKGTADDRHLWPSCIRAVREIQPSYVVGENVLGLLNWNRGMVFHEVQTDLEAAGFVIFPFVLPACGVNAPHRRDRVWFIAYSNSNRNRNIGKQDREASSIQGISRQTLHSREFVRTTTRHDTNSCGKGLQGREINGNTNRFGEDTKKQSDRFFPPTWEGFPTQPAIYCGDDGLSNELAGITVSKHRTESIKAYGNAIVPQVAFQIFKAIEQYEQQTTP